MLERERNEIDNSEIDSISLRDIYEIGINNWYWFVLSVFVCLSASFLFYQTKAPVFNATATIMIKINDKAGLPSEAAIFEDLGLGNPSSIIENEIHILRSSVLMHRIVSQLNLDIVYGKKTFFREFDLYHISPIEIIFPDKEFKELFVNSQVDVKILDKSRYQYRIYDRTLGDHISDWTEAHFGDSIESLRGKLLVNKTPLYNETFNNEEIVVRINSRKATSLNLLNALSVTRIEKRAGILKLAISNKSFLCATHILNTLISVYNADVIEDKKRVATNTEKFLLDRITTLSLDLDVVDGEMEKLKKDNSITDLSSSSGIMLEKGVRLQEEVVAIETEINLVYFIKDYLLDPAKKDELIPTIAISDVGIEGQIIAYNQELLYLNKIRENAGKNNPVTVDLIKRLNVTRANMVRSVDNSIASLNIKRTNAKAQEDIANRRIEDVPTQEKAITIISREQKIKSELYLYLLNKREENALNLAITESHARIIEHGDGSGIPISPRLVIFLFIGIMFGLAIPAGVLYLMSVMDNKVNGKFEIEKVCSIPILGDIPSRKKGIENFEISENSRDIMSEAYRIIRGNLNFLVKENNVVANVIQITSTMAGEAKTTAINNIALSYTHIGKRVLLIDLDLRKGSLSAKMNSARKKGMSDYLSEKISKYEDIIEKNINGHINIDFIPAGVLPPNPTSLLLSPIFYDLIQELKGNYDYIFLDTLPALVVADTVIINKVVDATIYVIRCGMLDKRYLPVLEKLYTSNKFTNMSILLTDASLSKSGYSYSYGYGYGYGYGEVEK